MRNMSVTLIVVLIGLAAAAQPLTSSLSHLTDHMRAWLDYLRQRVVVVVVDPESMQEPAEWFTQLPVAVQVAVGLRDLQLRQLKELSAHDETAVLVVPRSSTDFRRRTMAVLESDVFNISLVRVVFVLEAGETLPYGDFPEASCLVVASKGAVLDVALDQYRHCTRRKASANIPLPGVSSGGAWPALKGRKLTVVTEYAPRPGGISYNWTVAPESVALYEALRHLNVTIVPKRLFGTGKREERLNFVVQQKGADISLLPAQLSEEENVWVYLGAINSFRSLAFYSHKGSKMTPHLLPSLLSSALILSGVVFSGLCVACVYGAQGFLMKRRTSLSGMGLFLGANLFGKGYDPPPSSQYAITRLLCLAWAFGMMIFCTYLQSVFTSEMSLPTVSRDIDTMEDLRKFVEAGKVLPCLDRYSYMHKFILSSETGIADSLKKLLQKCPDTCLNRDTFYCYRLARKGTHVYLRVYDSSMSSFPSMFDLAPGKDVFRYTPAAVMTPKGFPHARAVRHLVLVLAQSGAVTFQEKRFKVLFKRLYSLKPREDPPVQVSFSEHFVMYVCGNLLAVGCFLLELVSRRTGRREAGQRKRKRRVRAANHAGAVLSDTSHQN